MNSQRRAWLAGAVLAVSIGCVGSDAQEASEAELLNEEVHTPTIGSIPAPAGFQRTESYGTPFGAWLASHPLLPGRPPVRLHDGRLKRNQDAHYRVLDIDVGAKDLQQCADATLRLRAEFLWQTRCRGEIAFRFTSGDLARWSEWAEGVRPEVRGNRVRWLPKAERDSGYDNFRRYLDTVFLYAGTASLARDLHPIEDPSRIQVGDLFLQGGYPGHAVIVLDRVENDSGQARILLGQSYMPAQQIHVLRRPNEPNDPWYPVRGDGVLETPEWTFRYTDAMRFPPNRCDARR